MRQRGPHGPTCLCAECIASDRDPQGPDMDTSHIMPQHVSGCMCDACVAERTANQQAIQALKDEGKWTEPGERINYDDGRHDVIGQQEAILFNICALKARRERAH